MDKKLSVIQDNALINSCYSLSLVEKRIILLALSQISDEDVDTEKTFIIHASEYMKVFDMQKQASYMALKDASNTLFDRYISTQGLSKLGNIRKLKVRWINLVGYVEKEGAIEIRFNPEVKPLLGYLKDRASYTKYFLNDVAGMQSVYAIRLYELIIAWRSTHKTPFFDIEELRNKLGVDLDEYQRMFDFKKRVLDVAINQINEHSNIKIEVEQHKKGRKIVGFSFSFVEIVKKETERDPNTVDWVDEDKKPKREKITISQLVSRYPTQTVGKTEPELYSMFGKQYHIVNN